MENWKMCTIADIGTVVGGATPSTKKIENYDGGMIAWITPKDLTNLSGRFISCGERNITEIGLKSCSTQIMPKHTILFSSRAPIGYIAIAENEMCTNQGFKSVIPNENTDYMFLYYLLKYNKRNVESLGSGTTFKEISASTMREIRISVPKSLAEQKAIASVLSTLDDKIELNKKINDNLEQQARILLAQWLIENEDNYEIVPLSDIAVINPDTYSPKDAWKYINYLDTSSIKDNIISEVQQINPLTEKLPSRARRIILANDVVFSTVRPNQRHFGIISEPLSNMLVSTGFAVIRSKNPYVSNELLYLRLTENSFVERMQQLAEQSTSTFPSIKPSDLGVCEIPCPIEQGLSDALKAIFVCISSNQRENVALSALRDTLLPKLMSGEIDCSAIMRQFYMTYKDRENEIIQSEIGQLG